MFSHPLMHFSTLSFIWQHTVLKLTGVVFIVNTHFLFSILLHLLLLLLLFLFIFIIIIIIIFFFIIIIIIVYIIIDYFFVCYI